MSVDAAAEEQFGPYLVYERLGVGGMATVHRALEQGAEGFERMVALKRLLPHLAEEGGGTQRLGREGKRAGGAPPAPRGAQGSRPLPAPRRLLPPLAEDASFIKSFVREAKLASLLNHV